MPPMTVPGSRAEAATSRTPGNRLAPFVGIDPRGLAALRIGLGAVLLADLATRTVRFRALYTDSGVFPRAFLDPPLRQWILPLHALSGTFWWEALLFAVAAGFALALLLGWHSRVASVASWVLLTSLQVRNPVVLNFGDEILRLAAFWSMFLPLGRCWSLDARRLGARGDPRAPECSIATAAYLSQIAFIYFFTALLKTGPDWREDGLALYYALHMDIWVTSLGLWVREIPGLLGFATRATLILESVGPFALFAPVWWIRTLTVLAFWALHLGIAASYWLGIFPWADLVVLVPFFPPRVWDALERWVPALRLPTGGGRAPEPQPRLARAQSGLVGALLLYVLLHNVDGVRSIGLPGWLDTAGQWIRINQKWRMFTPNAPHFDGWWVIPGTLAGGRQIDLSAHGPELTWRKPVRISADYSTFRWGLYMLQMSDPHTNFILRRRWAAWTCRGWNEKHPPEDRLLKVEMNFMSEETLPPGEEARVEKRFLLEYDCSSRLTRWPEGTRFRDDGLPPPDLGS